MVPAIPAKTVSVILCIPNELADLAVFSRSIEVVAVNFRSDSDVRFKSHVKPLIDLRINSQGTGLWGIKRGK